MAKPPASNKGPAPKTPAKTAKGRPAGLFTWIAVGLVVVVVVTLIIIKVTDGSKSSGSSTWQAADPAVVANLTGVPSSVFDTVGVTSSVVSVTPPQQIENQPPLTAKDSTGATLPLVLYIGAEYCPYCAAERWATIIALSRFGTFTGLGNMQSYSGDVYPNTPTFTFVKAKYVSKYVAFQSVELYTDVYDPSINYYTKLQTPTPEQQKILSTYDSSKWIHGMTPSQDGSIPFISYGNQFFVAGSSYSPATLAGTSREAIAAGLSDPTSPVTQAIITSANYQSAAICTLTGDQPSNVCSSKGVMAAKKVMGLK